MINQIYLNDNLNILAQMKEESVTLICTDPPFNSGRNYYSKEKEFTDIWKLDSISNKHLQQIESKKPVLAEFINLVGNMHSEQMKAYLIMISIRLIEMRRILKTEGSIYIHCDNNANNYLKIIMDIIFGSDQFRNTIIWCYKARGTLPSKKFSDKYDTILFYSKTKDNIFNQQYIEISEQEVNKKYPFIESNTNKRYYWHSKKKNRKAYFNGKGSPVLSYWTDINILNQVSKERTNYPTQKPVELYKRMIQTSSNKGDIILDPFCGSGTTLIAAKLLDRNYIGIDINESAINIAKERLKQ